MSLSSLTMQDLKGISDKFGDDVTSVWDFENSVEQYTSTGGTAKASVSQQIKHMETLLANSSNS